MMRSSAKKTTIVACMGLSTQSLSIAAGESSESGLSAEGNQNWDGWVAIAESAEGAPNNDLAKWGSVLFDCFGVKGSNGKLSAHPELDAVIAVRDRLKGRRDKGKTIELALILDKSDRRHVGHLKLIENWIERANEKAVDVCIRVVPIDVSISNSDNESNNNSQSNESLGTILDEAILASQSPVNVARLENTFITRVSEHISKSLSEGDVYLNIKSGTNYSKFALSQSALLATTKLRTEFARLGSKPNSGTPNAGTVHSPQAILAAASDEPHFPLSIPSQLSNAILQHRFARAVSLIHGKPGNSIEDAVADEGLWGLVTSDTGGTWKLTDTAWSLISAAEGYEGQPFSACADLLRRRGRIDLSGRLTVLIEHWVKQQLWRTNHANEMVLHNEAHSQVVDRHVSEFAEAIGQEKLPDEALYLLALTAWLHDWGHASGGTAGINPIDPEHVRKLHGLLTGKRLESKALQNHHQLNDQEKAWVKLLSEHHQGWTSSGDDLPKPDDTKLARSYGLEAKSFSCDLNSVSDELVEGNGGKLKSFATLMLAIIMIADGADFGRHRVPHAYGVVGSLLDQWSIKFNMKLSALRIADSVPNSSSGNFEKFANTFPDSEVEAAIKDPDSSLEVLECRIREFDKDLEELQELREECLNFIKHLREQHTYFRIHDTILGLYLVRNSSNSLDAYVRFDCTEPSDSEGCYSTDMSAPDRRLAIVPLPVVHKNSADSTDSKGSEEKTSQSDATELQNAKSKSKFATSLPEIRTRIIEAKKHITEYILKDLAENQNLRDALKNAGLEFKDVYEVSESKSV